VEGIVACAEAEAGQPLEPEPLDLRAEVSRVAGQARVRALHHGTAVDNHVPEGLLVKADPLALQQILFALLDNAVSHSPRHSHVQIDGARANGDIVLTISDNGPGLPTEIMSGIGRPFLRAGDPLTAGVGGLGLGLYLATLLTRRHGGRIWAQRPAERAGTRIHVALPAA